MSILRWLWYSVVLSLAPIVMSWIFLPDGRGVRDALSHGELAVLAQALAAASIGTLFESKRTSDVDVEILISLQVGVLVAGLLVFAGVAGGSKRLSPDLAVDASFWLLGLAVVNGAASVWQARR